MEISRYWRLQKQRYGLVGEVCPHCEYKVFPPRDYCPECNGECKTEFRFSGKGVVYSYTIVYDPPEGYEGNAPYVVAIVKLDEGPHVTAQLTDLELRDVVIKTPVVVNLGEPPKIVEVPGKEFVVGIGMPVEMVTRKLKEDGARGMLVYGYKFRPQLVPQNNG